MPQPIPKTTAEVTTITKSKESNFRYSPSYTEDQRHAKWKEVTNHKIIDPNVFTEPNQRFAAILARADRITNDPKFKSLQDETKQKVLEDYYDKYVAPGYTSLGFQAPDKALWLREMPKESGKLDSRSFFGSKNENQEQRESTGIKAGVQGLSEDFSYAGIKYSKKIAYAMTGLNHLLHLSDDYETASEYAKIDKREKELDDKVSRVSTGLFDSNNFWIQTHPSKYWGDRAESFIGEQVAQLPLYEAVGALKVGSLVSKAEKFIKVAEPAAEGGLETVKSLNLTGLLNSTPAGRFVARTLNEGATGYIAGILQNKDQKNSLADAASFMAFSSLGEGLGLAVGMPTRWAIKKFTGKNVAMGGVLFQNAVTDAAAHELDKDIIGHNSERKPISIKPETATSGYIHVGDGQYRYNNKEEQQTLIHAFTREHAEADPIHNRVMNAEKTTLLAMAKSAFGKEWKDLGPLQRQMLMGQREQLTREAVQEIAIHNPEIAKDKINQKLLAARKGNPQLAATLAKFEKLTGMSATDTVHQAEQETVRELNGIKSTQNTVKNIGADLKKTKNGIKNKNRTFKLPFDHPKIAAARKEEPRLYAQHKIDSLVYFKNQAKQAGSMKNLTKELNDADTDEFVDRIKDEMGRQFKFENPKHALLYANSFRDQLPRPFQKKLIETLHELYPNEHIAKWDEQSKNLAMHMQELAYTGRLFSVGNIFYSTRVEDWTDKTKFQLQLREEAEKIEMQKLRLIMKQFPTARAKTLAIMKEMQEIRRQAKNVDRYANLTGKIRNLPLKALKERLGK